ncbi:MAG TPA: MurR/RpiR family transcriptional regulator [Methylomirabilota bacterium]|nr:MurR/RpiR family transcriptional regulator [Methylomirabilota bacterium]
MQAQLVRDRIVGNFGTLPGQLQKAARFILENPDDVALLSMREQARRAGIQPWTMSRLAKRLGFDNYEAIRTVYADAMRQGAVGFAGRASAQVEVQKARGEIELARDIITLTAAQIHRLCEPAALRAMSEAAIRLDAARRIFCLGLRSSHSVASQFAYVMSLLGEKATLVDCRAGAGLDAIRMATPEDAILAVSIAPYTTATVQAARYAGSRGVPIVAITDSPVAPLAAIAQGVVLVTTDSPSFFHAMAPAFVVAEVLAALVAGRGGEASLAALTETERQLSEFGIHWRGEPQRKHA